MLIAGFDPGLRRPAVAVLDREPGSLSVNVVDIGFGVDTMKAKGAYKSEAWLFQPEPKKLKVQTLMYRMQRVDFLASRIMNMLHRNGVTHLAVEGYALRPSGSDMLAVELVAEVFGRCWRSNIALRQYPVQHIKLFATGKGNADKTAMVEVATKRFLSNLEQYRDSKAIEDIADALSIANLLHFELLARENPTLVPNMPEPTRRVFNSVTKTNPINLLSQDFAQRKGSHE